MKKLTLSIGLVAAILSTKAQDTTCTYFTGKRVIEFDYQTSEIIYEVEQNTRYYDIKVEYGDVLCLDFSDNKLKVRKVITTFFDGSVRKDVLDSENNVYYSPRGVVKVSVGKSRNIILGNYPQTLNLK
tara:strand:+ start:242 stop:625 length:384 start_codon:yes stop_codon:yes gene_type:complete